MSEQHLRKTDALVILGASRGIGESLVWESLNQGHLNLHLVSRNLSSLQKIQKLAKSKFPEANIQIHSKDLCSEKDLMSMVHGFQAEGEFPRHWVLVFGGTSSGKISKEPFESTPWAKLEEMVELNLVAPMRLLHQVLPELLRPNAEGLVEPSSIVAIASQAAHESLPGISAYAAAKHGLVGLLSSIREEVQDSNVKVSIVSPGYVDTELVPSHPNLDRAKMIPALDVAKAVLFVLNCSTPAAVTELQLRPQQSPWRG